MLVWYRLGRHVVQLGLDHVMPCVCVLNERLTHPTKIEEDEGQEAPEWRYGTLSVR
jgi:hypothetical protein